MSGVGRAELTERPLSDAGRPLRAQTQPEQASNLRQKLAVTGIGTVPCDSGRLLGW